MRNSPALNYFLNESKLQSFQPLVFLSSFRYTRNLVDAGNGKFNLMILCWGEGHGSAIHDHSESHCFMKMLRGELQEIRYAWPNSDDENDEKSSDDIGMSDEHSMEYDGQELQEISRSTMETDGVCYINGKY